MQQHVEPRGLGITGQHQPALFASGLPFYIGDVDGAVDIERLLGLGAGRVANRRRQSGDVGACLFNSKVQQDERPSTYSLR